MTAALVKDSAEHREMAQFWLAAGVDRKLVKPAVMTFPYGATSRTRREKIADFLVKRGMAGSREEAMVKFYKGSKHLEGVVDAAIRAKQPSALVAMDWLKLVAGIAAKKCQAPVQWQTPAGLWVRMARPQRKNVPAWSVVVSGRVVGRRRFMLDLPGTLDARRQKTGLSPNFIHSLDATHLMLTVNAARARGVESFAMVHDCYGTVAADAPVLAEVLRDEFAKMYEPHDPLAELRETLMHDWPDLRLPPVPERGTLEVSLVRQSDYFFS